MSVVPAQCLPDTSCHSLTRNTEEATQVEELDPLLALLLPIAFYAFLLYVLLAVSI